MKSSKPLLSVLFFLLFEDLLPLRVSHLLGVLFSLLHRVREGRSHACAPSWGPVRGRCLILDLISGLGLMACSYRADGRGL